MHKTTYHARYSNKRKPRSKLWRENMLVQRSNAIVIIINSYYSICFQERQIILVPVLVTIMKKASEKFDPSPLIMNLLVYINGRLSVIITKQTASNQLLIREMKNGNVLWWNILPSAVENDICCDQSSILKSYFTIFIAICDL